MNRSLAALLVAATLVVGVIVGAFAGGIVGGSSSPSPDTAAASPTAIPTPTGAPSPSDAPSPTASPSPTPLPTPTPEPTPVLVPAPLTGLPVTADEASRRVIAVMIDDLSAARPQSGLSDAGIVWHAPAEGGIPRYMALFSDGNPPDVGPVRSARLYYVAWAAEWNAAFLHAGGSPQAMSFLNTARGRRLVHDINAFRYEGRFLRRIASRYSPHNLYTTGRFMRRMAERVGAGPVEGQAPKWSFAPDAPLAQRPEGGTIRVPYYANKIVYRYDRESNRYLRSVSVEGKQKDAGTGKRIAPKNVVVIVMDFDPLNDRKHRLAADYVGKGVAWIATNGRTVKGTWSKASMKAPTLLFGRDGKPVTLTAGQTFVQVVQLGTKITIEDGKVPASPAAPSPTPAP